MIEKPIAEIRIQIYHPPDTSGELFFLEDDFNIVAFGSDFWELIKNYETAIAAGGVMP